MYDGVRNLFVESVLADHDAYEKVRRNGVAGESNDLRNAMHAATSMFHFSDHIFREFKGNAKAFSFKRLKDYHDYLIQKCSDFSLLRDCANAHKHAHLTRHNPSVLTADSMSEVIVITKYQDEKGPYAIAEKEIHIELKDGSTRVLHEILANVRSMWWDELSRLGVIQKPPAPSATQKRIPPRQVEGESARLDFRLRKGQRFKQTLILKNYNYEKDVAEVTDLSKKQR